jgi:hypothetical protein
VDNAATLQIDVKAGGGGGGGRSDELQARMTMHPPHSTFCRPSCIYTNKVGASQHNRMSHMQKVLSNANSAESLGRRGYCCLCTARLRHHNQIEAIHKD